MPDSSELRASDAEREQAVERLRAAAGEGRLTLEELAERIGSAYGARTAGDLERVTADLPAASAAGPPAAGEDRPGWVVAVMGGSDRKGRWRPRRRTRVVAVMGGSDIDLREAQIDAPEIEITAITIMGGIDVIVPDGVEVDFSGFAFMGGNEQPDDRGPTHPGAPAVRVRAFALMGGVDIKRKPSNALDTLRSAHDRLTSGPHGRRDR